MTAEEIERAAVEIVARTRAEQGKTRHVEDPEILTRVASEIRERPPRARAA